MHCQLLVSHSLLHLNLNFRFLCRAPEVRFLVPQKWPYLMFSIWLFCQKKVGFKMKSIIYFSIVQIVCVWSLPHLYTFIRLSLQRIEGKIESKKKGKKTAVTIKCDRMWQLLHLQSIVEIQIIPSCLFFYHLYFSFYPGKKLLTKQ